MKIAHVVSTFPPRLGGMGAVAFDECRGLAARGHTVTVFTLNYGDPSAPEDALNFRVVRLWPWIRGGDAGLAPQLTRELKQFDIIHLHYPWYGGAEWVLLAHKLYGRPFTLTYHMDAAPTVWHRRLVQRAYDLLLFRAIVKGASRVLMVNYAHALGSQLKQFLPPERMTELPNGVDTDLFRPDAHRDIPKEIFDWVGKKIILFVGNLLPVKRLDLLLSALNGIGDANVVLAVVGGGYAEEKYRKMTAELGLTARVRFVGPCHDRRQLVAYYNCSVCLVVSSDAESFSLVADEALASGCPVIASSLPELQNRLESAWLFTPGSAESLRDRLAAFLNLAPEFRQELASRGRERVVKQYSLSGHLDRLEKIYQEIIK